MLQGLPRADRDSILLPSCTTLDSDAGRLGEAPGALVGCFSKGREVGSASDWTGLPLTSSASALLSGQEAQAKHAPRWDSPSLMCMQVVGPVCQGFVIAGDEDRQSGCAAHRYGRPTLELLGSESWAG
jgi:hypothetical protein